MSDHMPPGLLEAWRDKFILAKWADEASLEDLRAAKKQPYYQSVGADWQRIIDDALAVKERAVNERLEEHRHRQSLRPQYVTVALSICGILASWIPVFVGRPLNDESLRRFDQFESRLSALETAVKNIESKLSQQESTPALPARSGKPETLPLDDNEK